MLKAYNERPFYELEGCRRTQYLEIDKPAPKPLPPMRYHFAEWKKERSGIDYHVSIEKHHYSVPYRYLKETIDVRISKSTLRYLTHDSRPE